MHLAILMTNTDVSAFAQRHPKDGVKFTAMMHGVRPSWTTQVFAVKDGVFPESLAGFEGVIITGSPASVLDHEPWIARLEALIREIMHRGLPLFGACFGHQAIAKALGGRVGPNPGGWIFGRVTMRVTDRPDWASDLPPTVDQYAAHAEQVTHPPAGIRVLLASDACPVGGFAIGRTVYTTQNHPEMTPAFAAALAEEYADHLPPDVAAAARASLSVPVDGRPYAESVARFFEQGD